MTKKYAFVLIASSFWIATICTASSLEKLNPEAHLISPQVSGEASMRVAAKTCAAEIFRRIGKAQVAVFGPCKYNDGHVGGVVRINNSYKLTYEIGFSPDRFERLFKNKKKLIVTCQTDLNGQITEFSDREDLDFFDNATEGLCLGWGQLF